MLDKTNLWLETTAIYNDRRQDLLKKLADLDAWYGEQNILLSVDEGRHPPTTSSERR